LQESRGKEKEFDQIPRLGGKFLWSQAVAAKQAGAKALYVAMFDELDEGTAIFKTTQDPPVGESRFLAEPGVKSDHYLEPVPKPRGFWRAGAEVFARLPPTPTSAAGPGGFRLHSCRRGGLPSISQAFRAWFSRRRF
jgi:hypothetical protein